MNKAVIFDLDNTLYEELTYVMSGFQSVASFLSKRFNISQQLLFDDMLFFLDKDGRGAVFNNILEKHKLENDELMIKTLLAIYRNHTPNICIPDEAMDLLDDLKREGYKLGLITDGDSSMQLRKLESLSLTRKFDYILHTDVLGKDYWKPSLTPFRILLEILDVEVGNAIYIGDKIDKDLVPARNLGIEAVLFTKFFHDLSSPVKEKKIDNYIELLKCIREKLG
jgi:putative hydrolase of the HAD superfamily